MAAGSTKPSSHHVKICMISSCNDTQRLTIHTEPG